MESFHGSGDWCCEFNGSSFSSSSSSVFLDSSWAFPSCFSGSDSVKFNGIEERGETASRSHRQAEKRRRDRINSHLVALRKLIPDSDKMDKAALLASVINHIKELKQKATETEDLSSLPTETDEITTISDNLSNQKSEIKSCNLFRVSVCCEDQPETLPEIIGVLNGLKLRTIRAEIVTVGGRMRIDVVVTSKGCTDTDVSVHRIKQSLSIALSSLSSATSSSSTCRIRSKRQRWFLSSNYS